MKSRGRIKREGCSSAINLLSADANHLPLAKNSLDGIISESVLVFTDLPSSLREINQVLRSGGILVDNELTYLSSPPPEMENLLTELFGIKTNEKEGWEDHYRRAVFDLINSSVHKIRLIDQIKSHLRVDGLKNYLKAVYSGLADKTIRRTFFNRELLKPFLSFRKYIGYGLYVLKKK
jgi:ubiquinone/menaquinone biosynthesis C-methylase UbiE